MKNNQTQSCLCGVSEYIVLSCSGASDVGQLSDLVARKLRDSGVRKMNCLAIVGAGIENSIKRFKESNLLMIDGCPTDCGKLMLDKAGFTDYELVRITDFGCKKGKTNISDDLILQIVNKTETIY